MLDINYSHWAPPWNQYIEPLIICHTLDTPHILSDSGKQNAMGWWGMVVYEKKNYSIGIIGYWVLLTYI